MTEMCQFIKYKEDEKRGEERRGEERRGTKGRTGRYVTRHNKRYLSCLFFQRFVALSKRQ